MEHYYKDSAKFGEVNNFKAEDIFRAAVSAAEDNAVFVELGTDRGRSAAFMGVEILNSGKPIKLTTVDHFQDPSLEMTCKLNLAPVQTVVKIQKSKSAVFANSFNDRSVDFVFVDAGHDYDSVKADILAWKPKIKLGGVIAGDDLWWRPPSEIDSAMPAWRYKGCGEYPVWRAVMECLDGHFEVLVRQHWALWRQKLE